MINVLLIESDSMARKLIEIYLSKNEKTNLVSSISEISKIKQICVTGKIDLVVVDTCEGMNFTGFDVARIIKEQFPKIKIIMITKMPECSYISRAKAVKIDSFWYKSSDEYELFNIIDLTMQGKSVYPLTTPVVKLGRALSDSFTKRELEVLREVVSGKMDAQIAEKLCLSVITVKQYIQKIREKTGFKNRTELAVKTRECGLIINVDGD